MSKNLSLRQNVIDIIADHYGTEPEYPWPKYSGNAVFRHQSNKKWFAIILPVSRDKLGLSGDDIVDVLNLKVDPVFSGSLLAGDGFFPAYHMNKDKWISVLLDGTVDIERISSLIDMSFDLTGGFAKKVQSGPRITKWIIPANPEYFDIDTEIKESDDKIIRWKQSSNICVGDTVYIYEGAPISSIRYKCRALEVDIPCEYEDEHIKMKRAMKLLVLETYEIGQFGIEFMKQHGVSAVRGPRSIPHSLEAKIQTRQ